MIYCGRNTDEFKKVCRWSYILNRKDDCTRKKYEEGEGGRRGGREEGELGGRWMRTMNLEVEVKRSCVSRDRGAGCKSVTVNPFRAQAGVLPVVASTFITNGTTR
jgi:hypothetical protein